MTCAIPKSYNKYIYRIYMSNVKEQVYISYMPFLYFSFILYMFFICHSKYCIYCVQLQAVTMRGLWLIKPASCKGSHVY